MIIKIPGVTDTSTPLLTEAHFETEEKLIEDLGELLESYNGKVSNLAMVGALTLYANMVSLGSLEAND